MRPAFTVPAAALLLAAVPMAVTALPAAPEPDQPAVNRFSDEFTGWSLSFLVVDRKTDEIRSERGSHTQYRSASLVKLLIALDYFETRGPDVDISPEDRALLEPMLRSSDDQAASELWVREGWETIVERMVDRLGLTGTEPPADRRIWGYTAISAADAVRIYQYLLEEADPPARQFILGNLRKATRCTTDGRDQYFGIPSTVDEPWAVKQGWSGYGEVEPGEGCDGLTPRRGSELTPPEASPDVPEAGIRAQVTKGPDIDLERHALHTSGTIGPDNRTIMVVLSLHGEGTSYEDSAQRLTAITRALYVASRPDCAT